MFNLSDEDEETKKTEQEEPIDLFDLGDNEEENDDEEAIDLSALGNDENETDDNDEEIDLFNLGEENKEEKPQQNQYVENKKKNWYKQHINQVEQNLIH